MGGVFVNYRTGDGEWAAALIARELACQFGENNVFFASQSIRPGQDFSERIIEALRGCDVLLATIGHRWLTTLDRNGRRRIDDPTDWVHREIAEAFDHGLNVIPIMLDGVDQLAATDLPNEIARLAGCQHLRIDHRNRNRDIPDLLTKLTPLIPLPQCPYRGLLPFGFDDAPFFFGRDRETDRLVDLVGTQSVVIVAGPSGSGKSSLIHAGLLPRLSASMRWVVFRPIPGQAPRELLGDVLNAALGTDWDRAHLPGDLVELARRVIAEVGQLVLCADQFEELVAADPAAAGELFDLMVRLGRATVAPGARPVLRAVFTVRSADLDSVVSAELAGVMEQATVYLRGMDRERLRVAIIEPAAATGMSFEPGLVERILDEARDAPSQLPLVEFALTRLWATHQPGMLTHEAYDRMGGIAGALASHAEYVYGQQLSAGQRELAQRLLVQLVRPSEDGSFVLSPIRVDHLASSMRELAIELSRHRLVAIRQDTNQPEVVALAHEALIRAWPQLRDWLLAAQQFRTWQERLRASLVQWRDTEHDPGGLLRGVALAAAEDWLGRNPDGIIETEREFIAASSAAHEREQTVTRRRTRRLRRLVVALAVLLAVAMAASVLAIRNQNAALEAEQATARELNVVLSQKVAREATEIRDADPDLAAQLALVAYRLTPTIEARAALLTAGSRPASIELSAAGLESTPVLSHDVAFGSAGNVLAIGGTDIGGGVTASLWDLADLHNPMWLANVPGDTKKHPNDPVFSFVEFSPDGRTLAVGGFYDQVVRLWDVTDLRKPRQLGSFTAFGSNLHAIAFSPDGHTIAAVGTDKHSAEGVVRGLRLWDITNADNPTRLTSLTYTTDQFGHGAVTFTMDGQILVTAVGRHLAQVWDVTDLHQPKVLNHLGGYIASAAANPVNRTVATASTGGVVKLWDLTDPSAPATLSSLVADPNGTVVKFSPDGRILATGGISTTKLWDVTDLHHPTAPATFATNKDFGLGHHHAGSVAIRADNRALAVAGDETAVRLWDIDIDRVASKICAAIKTPITQEQWQKYIPDLDFAPPC